MCAGMNRRLPAISYYIVLRIWSARRSHIFVITKCLLTLHLYRSYKRGDSLPIQSFDAAPYLWKIQDFLVFRVFSTARLYIMDTYMYPLKGTLTMGGGLADQNPRILRPCSYHNYICMTL